MSKILKDVGIIVGVAALAIVTGGAAVGLGISLATSVAGISAGTLLTISAGLEFAGSLLAPKPKIPTVSDANADRLTVSVNLRTPRTTVFGHTAMATDLRDQEYTDSQAYLHRFLVAAGHRVQSIDEIWFDDQQAWTSTGGVTSAFAGYLTVTPIVEGSAANAINISSRMGSTRRFTGCAYVYLRYKLTGNSKKTDSPFAQSITSRVTIVGKGALIYDPRHDDTQGGSGPQRADDQTTWAWDDNAARNPALQALWWLLGWRIKNPTTGEWKLSVGKGVPPARIDIGSFITAANLCDETVNKADGTTEPRYRSDGIFTEGDDLSTVLDNLKAAMNAVIDDIDGLLRITVLHNDLASPVGDLTTDDVLGAFTWNQTQQLSDTINVITGGYTDPSAASLYQLVDYPEVRIDSPDGIDRTDNVDLPLVQSPSQAQRVIKLRLQRGLYAGTFQATFQATAWKFQKGDVVRFTFAPLGWNAKLFRIAQITVQVDGTVPMTLREENDDLYLWDNDESPAVQGVDPTTYDPLQSPTTQAIDDAYVQIAAALTAAEAASELATGKTTIFYQSTAPTAAESQPNDQWINTAAGNISLIRVAGSGLLAIGGNLITFNGAYLEMPWIEAPDQRIDQALIAAAGAQATADGKVTTFNQEATPTATGIGDLWYQPSTKTLSRWSGLAWVAVSTYGATSAEAASIAASEQAISTIADDNILSKGEKPQFVREWQEAEARYTAIDAKAAGFANVAAQRAALTAAYTTLSNTIGAITPAFDDTSADSPISGDSLQANWNGFYTAYAALDMALTAQTLTVQWSVDGATNWHTDPVPGDKWIRQSIDGGTTFGDPIKVVGEDGAPGTDGVDGQHTSFAFIRAAAQPATPNDAVTPPAGWSDAPPAQTDPATPLWMTQANFRDATKLTAWSAPVKLIASSLEDLDPDAAALLSEAMNVASGKNTIFRQATPPAAAASQPNDIWINTAAGNRTMQRVAGSGLLSIGGNLITFAGNHLDLAWIEAPDAQLGQALTQIAAVVAQATAAQATADDAVASIEDLGDDGQLTPVEKQSLIQRDASLDGAWGVLDAQAATFGVTTERTAASTARSAWISYRNGLSPAWNDTTTTTAVSRTTLRATLTAYDTALTTLQKAISAAAALRAEYDLVSGSKPPTNADNTAENQIVITPPPVVTVTADYTGAVTPGLLPITTSATVSRGSNDISQDNSVSYAVSNIAATLGSVTVNNTNGDPAKGKISIDAVTGNGQFDLNVSVNGQPQPAVPVEVDFKLGSPPSGGGGGGGGGTASQDLTSFGVTSGSFASLVLFSNLSLASGHSISCHASGSYDLLSTGTSGAVEAKWQYSPAGANTWTDMAAAVTGSIARGGTVPRSGSVTCNQSATPAAGSYDVRLVALTTGAVLRFDDGTASAVIS